MDPHTSSMVRVILTVLVGALGLAGCLPAACTPMLFDAPGSERNPATRLLALSVAAFPIVCLATVLLAWARSGQGAGSLRWFLLPVMNVMMVILALVWSLVVYGGRLAG